MDQLGEFHNIYRILKFRTNLERTARYRFFFFYSYFFYFCNASKQTHRDGNSIIALCTCEINNQTIKVRISVSIFLEILFITRLFFCFQADHTRKWYISVKQNIKTNDLYANEDYGSNGTSRGNGNGSLCLIHQSIIMLSKAITQRTAEFSVTVSAETHQQNPHSLLKGKLINWRSSRTLDSL